MFRVRRINVSSTTILNHTEALQHQTAKYPIDLINCKVFSVPRGNLSGNHANIFQGPLPARVVIGMEDADNIPMSHIPRIILILKITSKHFLV